MTIAARVSSSPPHLNSDCPQSLRDARLEVQIVKCDWIVYMKCARDVLDGESVNVRCVNGQVLVNA